MNILNEPPKEDLVIVLRRVHRQLTTGVADIINPKLVADAADEIEALRKALGDTARREGAANARLMRYEM